jgi:hypothetical protein
LTDELEDLESEVREGSEKELLEEVTNGGASVKRSRPHERRVLPHDVLGA